MRRRPAAAAVDPLNAIARRSRKSWSKCSISLCSASRIAWSRLPRRLADAITSQSPMRRSASRPGSLDQAIREAEHNRIEHLLHDYGDLVAIAFNGSTASATGRRLIGASAGHISLIDLPSSSAANTTAFAEKRKAWSRLAEFAAPAQIGPHEHR